MEWVVSLYAAGKVFQEEVISEDREDALRTAKARNPTAKVMGVSPQVHHPHKQQST